MGITIIQKSQLNRIKSNPNVALVLAGGAISGAAFKIGGLKALNDYLVNRKLTEFDTYIGISAGAILSVPLCGGISPEEMLASLDGKSRIFSQMSPFDLYQPNWKEYITRPLRYFYGQLSFLPGVVFDLISESPKLKDEVFELCLEFIKHPSYSNYENFTKPMLKIAYANRHIPAFGELIPSGLFDSSPIEHYLRENMRRNKMPNNFRVLKRATGRSLYMSAMDLDTSARIIFGPDEKNDITVSEAAYASSAIPGFYKPARVKGIDYIDGGVRKTANISLAFDKGADLVICYNPFRPYNNEILLEYVREQNKYITKNKRMSDWGIGAVLNQVFRTLFHSRLMAGLENLQNDVNFKKDIILIEPTEDDNDFFTMNPLFFWNRAKAAMLGFDSVTQSISKHFEPISKVLSAYGIEMSSEQIQNDLDRIQQSHKDETVIMQVLERTHPSHKKSHKSGSKSGDLKVISGGKK